MIASIRFDSIRTPHLQDGRSLMFVAYVTQDLLPVTLGGTVHDDLLDTAKGTQFINHIGMHNLHAIRFNSMTDVQAFDIYSSMNIEKDGIYSQGAADFVCSEANDGSGEKVIFIAQGAKR